MSSSVSLEYLNTVIANNGNGISSDGGYYVTLINKTGSNSVKGTIVIASTTIDNAVDIAPINSDSPIGIILEDGISDGNSVKVVVSGKAYVLLANSTASTRGYWCEVSSTQAGRMSQLANPNPVTHWSELGHSLESKTAGTNILSLVVLHFN